LDHPLLHDTSFAMPESVQKRLTVTFKDVAVQVASLSGSYGATVASVVLDLMPSCGKAKAPSRVSSKSEDA
jgi:hypothetical protein